MFNPWVTLLLLHVVILAVGSTAFWAAGRSPRTVVIVSGFLVAGGGWAMWSAGDVIDAAGLDAGERLLRIGQWAVALGIAVWGLVALVSRTPQTQSVHARWANWAMSMTGYWFLCFVVASFEGLIIFLGTTPHGQFR
jgi:hypothetical protein